MAYTPTLITIWPFSLESVGPSLAALTNLGPANAASALWTQDHRIVYVPFVMTTPLLVVKLMSHNGAVASGNTDIGIYTEDGTRMVSSGSTAQSGTAVQEFDVTDTLLGVGTYYLAVTKNESATGTIRRVASGNVMFCRALGLALEDAVSFGLPATATFASMTVDTIPMIGLTGRTVV